MSLSSLVAEEEKIKRLKEYKDFKEILRKQLEDLNGEIKVLKTTLIPIKPKEEILKDPQKPQLKKHFMISDDDVARKNAVSLVSKLNKERKLKEQKRMKEIEDIEKNLKGNIESIKKERIELENQAKFEKKNRYLTKMHTNQAKKKEFFLQPNVDPLELLAQFKNNSQLNESLNKDKTKVSPDLLAKKKEELNKIRNLLKNK